jgi:hypothetical protein
MTILIVGAIYRQTCLAGRPERIEWGMATQAAGKRGMIGLFCEKNDYSTKNTTLLT